MAITINGATITANVVNGTDVQVKIVNGTNVFTKNKKVVICDGANGAVCIAWSWTNTTGKNLKVYYSLLCEGGDYSSIWVGGYGEGTEVVVAHAGASAKTGSFSVAPGQKIEIYNGVEAVSTTNMYYMTGEMS